MNLIIEDLQDKLIVDGEIEDIVQSAVLKTLEYEGFEKACEVGVTFVDNTQIQELNKNHRDIDKPTDVLSFPLVDFSNHEEDDEFAYHDGNLMLGDVIISLEKAREQSIEYGHSLKREVGFLTVHSILHLLGYDHEDESDSKVMRKKEEGILENINLAR